MAVRSLYPLQLPSIKPSSTAVKAAITVASSIIESATVDLRPSVIEQHCFIASKLTVEMACLQVAVIEEGIADSIG